MHILHEKLSLLMVYLGMDTTQMFVVSVEIVSLSAAKTVETASIS